MLVYHLEYLAAAETEIVEAAQWYMARSAIAAQHFVLELEQKIHLIMESPEQWPLFESGTRRITLHRFPYSVIYRVAENRIIIIAVMHQKRRPGYWSKR